MATSYPYTSSQGSLVKAVEQFRKNFPATIDAATLQKFSIAPANESYVINTLRFLGLIDESGKKLDSVTDFFLHGDAQFQNGLEALLKGAYADLYNELGAEPWTASKEALSTWFRVTDKTSDLIGARQASTYLTLASLAGKGEPVKSTASGASTKSSAASSPKPSTTKKPAAQKNTSVKNNDTAGKAAENLFGGPFGLTVRVEVNLPAGGTPDDYDAIFASIRKNLIEQ